MIGRERCMIYKPAKTIRPVKNQRPSTPLCPNCLMTELYCTAVRDMEQRACCFQCEHISLGPNEAEA